IYNISGTTTSPYKAVVAFLFSKLNDRTTPQSCNFQTVRDNTKQSDWPLPAKIAPHLHTIKHSPTFVARYAQNAVRRHNGLPPNRNEWELELRLQHYVGMCSYCKG